jgi:hypothetical protein
MFKKIKPIWLVIILIILLGAYFIVRYTGQNDRNFRGKVLEFDPKSITEVLVTLPGQPEPNRMLREGNEWKVFINGQPYRADTNAMISMLGQLSRLETKRFAGKGKEKWEQYELTDSTGVRVVLKEGNKEVGDIMVGKFDYTQTPQGQPTGGMSQPPAEMSSYVRLTDEKEVYVVEGFLKMAVGRDLETYRDKVLVGVKRNDINRVTFDYQDSKMILEKEENKWLIDGQPADSLESVRYATMIARMAGQEFIYEDMQLDNPSHTVTIEGNNFTPIEIQAYPVADTNYNYVITSTKNPALFNGKKSDLFNRVFVDKDAFMPDPDEGE